MYRMLAAATVAVALVLGIAATSAQAAPLECGRCGGRG